MQILAFLFHALHAARIKSIKALALEFPTIIEHCGSQRSEWKVHKFLPQASLLLVSMDAVVRLARCSFGATFALHLPFLWNVFIECLHPPSQSSQNRARRTRRRTLQMWQILRQSNPQDLGMKACRHFFCSCCHFWPLLFLCVLCKCNLSLAIYVMFAL